MRHDVLIRRAARGATAQKVLDILNREGPLPRSELTRLTGVKVDQTLATLEKRGLISSFDAANEFSEKKFSRIIVRHFQFVSYPPGETKLERYARVLEAHGFTVLPPNKD